MTLQTERTILRNQPTTAGSSSPHPKPPAKTGNPLTLSATVRLDAETIRAALSVLPTAVEDGTE